MATKAKTPPATGTPAENSVLDGVVERLYRLRKIELGIAQADAGDLIDHDTSKSELEREDVE
jgi:predicted transcriptional regulator